MPKSVAEAAEKAMNKYKKRMWRFCKCGTAWAIIAIVCIVVAIALMVAYSKYWGDETEWKRGLAYFGLALLLLGLFFVAVSVVLCATLCIIWRRLEGDHYSGKNTFKPPQYEYGKAPYPQQPPPQGPAVPPSMDPSAPLQPPQQADPEKVHIEVEENNRF